MGAIAARGLAVSTKSGDHEASRCQLEAFPRWPGCAACATFCASRMPNRSRSTIAPRRRTCRPGISCLFRPAFGGRPEYLTRLRLDGLGGARADGRRSPMCFDVGFTSLGSFCTLFKDPYIARGFAACRSWVWCPAGRRCRYSFASPIASAAIAAALATNNNSA